MPAASAVEDRDSTAKTMLTITLMCPGRRQVAHRGLGELTSRSVMPAEFIRFAASTKNGTASRMKELYDLHISCGGERSQPGIGDQHGDARQPQGKRHRDAQEDQRDQAAKHNQCDQTGAHPDMSGSVALSKRASSTIFSTRKTTHVTPPKGKAA